MSANAVVEVRLDGVVLPGILRIPERPTMIVLFAHGSGSSRLSPRNNSIARVFRSGGVASLLTDLLTVEEDADYAMRFDIALLSERLGDVVEWLGKQPATRDLLIGLFGASTGAAAALQVAARLGDRIVAVVSRGGRPDMALGALPQVVSPTLLIVGGYDDHVIELNRIAFRALRCEKELKIVPGATHLFEEPGTLEQVADLALEWFKRFAEARQVSAPAASAGD